MEDLFGPIDDTRPVCVYLPQVVLPEHHYRVRAVLLDFDWVEFEEWRIQISPYGVWFKDARKATYFKVSFTL